MTSERGSGPISAAIGFLVFLSFLLLAVQILMGLYATTVVTAVAADSAHRVANSGNDPAAVAEAEVEGRKLLGRYGNDAVFDWSTSGPDDEVIVLRVRAPKPSVLPALASRLSGTKVDRTVRVRTERFG